MTADGTDLFLPMTSTISLHITSFTLFMAFTNSSSPSNSELSLTLVDSMVTGIYREAAVPTGRKSVSQAMAESPLVN
jgi:hypothetical protein